MRVLKSAPTQSEHDPLTQVRAAAAAVPHGPRLQLAERTVQRARAELAEADEKLHLAIERRGGSDERADLDREVLAADAARAAASKRVDMARAELGEEQQVRVVAVRRALRPFRDQAGRALADAIALADGARRLLLALADAEARAGGEPSLLPWVDLSGLETLARRLNGGAP